MMIFRDRRMIQWGLILVCWAIVALFYTTQALIQNPYLSTPLVWWRVGIWESYFCLIWFGLTPLVLWWAKKFPLVYGKVLRNLSIYIIASIVVSLFHLILFTAGSPLLPGYREAKTELGFQFFATYQLYTASYLHFCLISFWGILLVNYLVKYYRDFQERSLKASQLEASLAQSQLQLLKSQLQPHFLFNTLNSISVLMQEDSKAANQMLLRLSELLRFALKGEALQIVPLSEELDFLQHYLDIEKTRFQDRLSVEYDIDDKILNIGIPSLILQPLVENAIRHGIAPRAEGGEVRIRARSDGDYIELSISDNGVGLAEGSAVSHGIGLQNTQERLRKLYGDDQQFEIVGIEDGGLQVKMRVPLTDNDRQNSSIDCG